MKTISLFFGVISMFFAAALFAAVNLNTATEAELAALNGVGPTKAEAIVKYRQDHGPFESVDGITSVKGIGAATLEKNRSELTVEKPKKAKKAKSSKKSK